MLNSDFLPAFVPHYSQTELHIRNQKNGIYRVVLYTRPQISISICIVTVDHFKNFKTICLSRRHLIPESEQIASYRSSGCYVLRVRHTARFQVLPGKFALRRSLRVARTEPSRPVNYWKHANSDGMFAACKDEYESASWVATAVDPTKWPRKGPVPFPELVCSRSATTSKKHIGLVGRDLHIHV